MTLDEALAYFGLTVTDAKIEENGPFLYVDKDGCHHHGLNGYAHHVLGFCGCGEPDRVLELVVGAMQFMVPRDEARRGPEDVLQRIVDDMSFFRVMAEEQSVWWLAHGGDVTRYLVGYLLDDKGLTEHGSTVRAAWLTDKGKAFKVLAEAGLASAALLGET